MSSDLFLPGAFISANYRVERVIGRGGMGIVVEAAHTLLNHRVAVKVLTMPCADDEVVERFLQEARVAANLPADHIVRVTDIGRTPDGKPFLVMELLDGNDLAEELAQRRRLPATEAVDLMLQAFEGVAEAHAKALVHRDLKPANIFLVKRRGRAPLVKVLDFGLSKAPREFRGRSDEMTGSHSTFGTPQYMSPEQVRSTKDVDARTDQHALALVLFQLVTGRAAFEAKSVVDLLVAITATPAPPLRSMMPSAPRGLEDALARALQKKPADRFPSIAEFAEAIAPFGGPGAAASAGNVRAILLHKGASKTSPPPAGPTRPDGAAVGAHGAPSPPDTPESVTGFTTSRDPLKKRKRRIAMGALTLGLGIAVGVGVLVFVVRAAPEPDAATQAAASAPPTALAASTASAEPAAAASAPQPDASADPSASHDSGPLSSATAAPSGSASATAHAPPGRPPPGGRKGNDAIKAFGGRRK